MTKWIVEINQSIKIANKFGLRRGECIKLQNVFIIKMGRNKPKIYQCSDNEHAEKY